MPWLLQTVFIREIKESETILAFNYYSFKDRPSWVWIPKVFAPDPAPERRPEAGHRLLERPASEPAAATCGRKSEERSKLVQVAASGVWVFRIQGSSFLYNSWKLLKVILTFPGGERVVWTSAGELGL